MVSVQLEYSTYACLMMHEDDHFIKALSRYIFYNTISVPHCFSVRLIEGTFLKDVCPNLKCRNSYLQCDYVRERAVSLNAVGTGFPWLDLAGKADQPSDSFSAPPR